MRSGSAFCIPSISLLGRGRCLPWLTRPSTSTTQLKELRSFSRDAIAVNEALLLSSLRQHELTEASELLNRQLQAEIVVRQKTEEALAESEKRSASPSMSVLMSSDVKTLRPDCWEPSNDSALTPVS